MRTHELYSDGNGNIFDAKTGKQRFPKKQNLSDSELSTQNFRGYAALIQEVFYCVERKNDQLLSNYGLDPFSTIEIGPEKARDLVESAEIALNMLSLRGQEILRLRFNLDMSRDSKFMSLEDIGKEIKDINQNKPVCKERARQIINEQERFIKHPLWGGQIARRLWGNKATP
jgi:hypothetical protein